MPATDQPLSASVQQLHLQRVSRSFALSIPLLRPQLASLVAHSYLHLRIIDTIEDELDLPHAERVILLRRLADLYLDHLSDLRALRQLNAELLDALPPCRAPHVRELLEDYLPLAHRFLILEPGFRYALCRCAVIMAQGMADTLEQGPVHDYAQLETYCYTSAGVVGQFLSRLFAACPHCPAQRIAARGRADDVRQDTLAVSFAQGLQMINMLRDALHDHRQGRGWLTPGELRSAHFAGLCRTHLDSGLSFVQLFSPRSACDIRHFCLFNAALACAVLRMHLQGSPPRPGHAEVRALLLLSWAAARSNRVLKGGAGIVSRGLPPPAAAGLDGLLARVSRWPD